jgi:hypothetical protein
MAIPVVLDSQRIIERLFAQERNIIDMAERFDLELKPSPEDLTPHLISLSPRSLNRIEFNLWALLGVWQRCEAENVDPWDDREFLKLSMRALGLSFPKDFTEKLSSDDLVEGYDQDRFQIFRNMKFMETSSYSLLEIQSYEWPRLFERSDAITQSLIHYCDDVLWKNNATIALHIPEHVICEIRTKQAQACSVRFRHMAPVFFGPNRPFGLLVSCRADVLGAYAQETIPPNISLIMS